MRIVPAGNGWSWLVLGWALFRKQPLPWIMLTMLLLFASVFVNMIPLVGPFVASALIPAFSLGLMVACAEAEAGRPPIPGAIMTGFRQGGAALAKLGGYYLIFMLLTLGISSLADEGVLMRQVLFGTIPPETALKDGSYVSALGLATIVATPAFMAFWFAPILVAWHRMGIGQAMFYSFFASLRNWRAFTVYGLALFGGLMLLSMSLAVIGLSLGAGVEALRGAMLGFLLVMLPAVTASFYYSYRDVFRPPDDTVPVTEQAAAVD
jgi:hypothetical protein